jgi:T5SS/PEP-CTERM-associated repeat protein
MPSMRRSFAFILPCLVLVGSVHADNSSWVNPRGGIFSLGGNWSAGVPDGADTAVFDLAASYEVLFATTAATNRAVVQSGDVTLDLGGGTWVLSNATVLKPSLVVGDLARDEALLRITQGTVAGTFMDVGRAAGSSGTLVLDDASATLALSQARIGYQGDGTLLLSGGAQLTSDTSHIGALDGATGAADVSGAGTAWVNAGLLNVGKNGGGSLTVSDDAAVSCAGMIIGHQLGSSGAATVSGGVLTCTDSVDIGFDSTGSLVMAGGATVSISGFVTVGTLTPGPFDPPEVTGGIGTLSVLGAATSLTIGDDLFVPFFGEATLAMSSGARMVVEDDLEMNFLGEFKLTLTAPESDASAFIQVSDQAALGGASLIVTLADGFQPTSGAQFTLMSAASIKGSFGLESLPDLPGALEWVLDVADTTVTLSVTGVFGDLNGDGDVDGADLGLFLAVWGTDNAVADLNGDQIVDGVDLGRLLAAWTAE